jgi:hypothetical protein
VEIAKFVLTAIGTFISVSGLTFAVFQFWAKRRDEKDRAFKDSVREDIDAERKQLHLERGERKEAVDRLSKKVDLLETSIMQALQNRIGNIEGELKGMREILKAIQNWFITNTPSGGK